MLSFKDYLEEAKGGFLKAANQHRKLANDAHAIAWKLGRDHPDYAKHASAYSKHMSDFHTALADHAKNGKAMDNGRYEDEHRTAAAHYARGIKEDVLDEANSKATAKVKLQHYQHKATETEKNIRSADYDKNPMARHGNQAFVGTLGSKKRRATLLKIKRMKQASAVARSMVTTSDRPNYNMPKGTFLSGGKKKPE